MAEGDGIDPKKLAEKASAMDKLAAATKGVAGSLSNVSNAATGFFSAFGGLDLSISSIISFGLEIDKARAEMAKATGAAEGLGSAMAASREHIQGLAIRYEELSQHTATAYQNIAIFSEASVKSQGAMLGATAALTKLGVGAEVTAKNINTMTKGLGMSVDEAAKLNMDIAKVSKSLGSFMTPGKMAQEFSNAAPTLAAYGKNMEQEFFKLASQAKATGMEMQGLLGVAGKFDTFEDAASTTAQLNALMGTQLNSVDMLTASEGERIEMLKESVAASGKSWETMDRFEKKALAGAVGMSDLAEAGKLFGTSMEDMDEAQEAADPALVKQEELNKSMQKAVSIGEVWEAKLESIKMKLANAIMPHVMRFFTWMTSAPKGQKSPLDHMVDAMLDFIGLVEVHLIKPFNTFWESLDEGEKGMTAKIMGIVLAFGPVMAMAVAIGGLFMTIIGPVMSVIGVIGTLVGIIAGLVSWPVLIVAAFALMFLALGNNFEDFKVFVAKIWVDLKDAFLFSWRVADRLITKLIGIDRWVNFKNYVMGVWQDLKDGLFGVFTGFGEWIKENIINNIITAINLLMINVWESLPEVALKGLKVMGLEEPPQIERLHEGGPLVGPAIVKNDEYIIMPPANAPAGQVLTPQQMAKTDDKPVTVVINIDGRQFVRETVFPVLNKEFNLQGI
jgi:hypothetical protein